MEHARANLHHADDPVVAHASTPYSAWRWAVRRAAAAVSVTAGCTAIVSARQAALSLVQGPGLRPRPAASMPADSCFTHPLAPPESATCPASRLDAPKGEGREERARAAIPAQDLRARGPAQLIDPVRDRLVELPREVQGLRRERRLGPRPGRSARHDDPGQVQVSLDGLRGPAGPFRARGEGSQHAVSEVHVCLIVLPASDCQAGLSGTVC